MRAAASAAGLTVPCWTRRATACGASRSTAARADWFKRFDIRGRTALQVHARDESSATDGLALSVRANYLATVNDLAEPVQKNRRQNHEGDVYFAAHSRSLKAESSEFRVQS